MTSRENSGDGCSQVSTEHHKPTPVVVVGNFKVMYRPGLAFEQAKMRLIRQGLDVQETAHFLFAHIPNGRLVTLVHRLSAREIDNNIGHYLMQELAPYGLVTSEQAFGAALIGTVTSIAPREPLHAWGLFSLNTLERLREKLDDPTLQMGQSDFISPFASIYHRLLSLKVGTSLLDVGCACAFWPLLVAEREQKVEKKIVGVDNRSDAIALSSNLASLAKISGVEFMQADLLAPEFIEVGVFDTVTAIHLLEHFPETQLPLALTHLLQVTRRRLLIAVPYEQQPEVAYGHEQVFSQEKLEVCGKWCVEQLSGKGEAYYEDVQGGLLVIDRIG